MKDLDTLERSTPEEDFSPIKEKGKRVTRPKVKSERKTGKPAGRPKGSTAKKTIVVRVNAPRCPTCQSSARGSYVGTASRERIDGIFEGKEFNLITTRRTRCRCGQVRLEKEYEKI